MEAFYKALRSGWSSIGQLLVLSLLTAFVAAGANALDKAAVERQFQTWLEKTIWAEARKKGVSRATFDRAFSGVTLNWDLPDLVPPGTQAVIPSDQQQAEFGSPARYFRPNALSSVATTGRQLARRHADTLARIEQRTGVPARIIIAIWGRESGFGRAAITHDIFEVLGTKGFMSTRADRFTQELIAALQIAEAGHAPKGRMKSSWAGALGQPQFLPSSYLAHAADGDGDGDTDIWRSEADTFASIGAYLQHHGWINGRDWGFEVKVPASVSCTLEGPDQGRDIADWAAMGITRISGRPFPDHEAQAEGFLMMPAGRNGPAFIVTPNFYILKDYNFSDLYALYVGHMGDRVQYGMGDFKGAWGRTDTLYRSDIAAVQRALESQGHDVGGADGLAGFKTRRSIGRWQETKGKQATCFPNREIVNALAEIQ